MSNKGSRKSDTRHSRDRRKCNSQTAAQVKDQSCSKLRRAVKSKQTKVVVKKKKKRNTNPNRGWKTNSQPDLKFGNPD